MPVVEIESGLRLEGAVVEPPENFFSKRMENRARKANVGSWLILYESKDSVFYGYPLFSGIFSDGRIVKTLYATNKQALEKFFPGYRTLTGVELRQTVYSYIAREKSSCEAEDRNRWRIEKLSDSMECQTRCNDGSLLRFRLDLSTGNVRSVSRETSSENPKTNSLPREM